MNRSGFIMPIMVVMIALVLGSVVLGYNSIVLGYQTIFDRVQYTQQYYLTEALCNAAIKTAKQKFDTLTPYPYTMQTPIAQFNKSYVGNCELSKTSKSAVNITVQLIQSKHTLSSLSCTLIQTTMQNKQKTYSIHQWKQHVL